MRSLEITEFVQEAAGNECDIIWGNCNDESLGEHIMVTLIATGFETEKERRQKQQSRNVKRMSLDSDEDAGITVSTEAIIEELEPEPPVVLDEAPETKHPEEEIRVTCLQLDEENQGSSHLSSRILFDEMQNDQMDEDIRQQEEPDSLQFEIRKRKKPKMMNLNWKYRQEWNITKPDLADNKDRMRMINQQENERVKG